MAWVSRPLPETGKVSGKAKPESLCRLTMRVEHSNTDYSGRATCKRMNRRGLLGLIGVLSRTIKLSRPL